MARAQVIAVEQNTLAIKLVTLNGARHEDGKQFHQLYAWIRGKNGIWPATVEPFVLKISAEPQCGGGVGEKMRDRRG